MEACNRVLRETFRYPEYRGKQEQIIEAAIMGQDVFVLAPTGMGKVCQQCFSMLPLHLIV
jgi:superfamily II DNA helicase RecQ